MDGEARGERRLGCAAVALSQSRAPSSCRLEANRRGKEAEADGKLVSKASEPDAEREAGRGAHKRLRALGGRIGIEVSWGRLDFALKRGG